MKYFLRQLSLRFSFLDKTIGAFIGLTLLLYLFALGTPLSFSLVYRSLGLDSKNILGMSQPIRSDEWGAYTPTLIAAKNSNWNTFHPFSPFHNRFDPAFPVPRHSISMIFDVLQWPFMVLPAPIALSLFWVCLFGIAFFGWRILLVKLGIPIWLAWVGAFLLFFNSYQQAWLTVLGINLILMPLICLSVIHARKGPIRYFYPFAIGAISLSITSYIPGVIAVLYGAVCFALMQLIARKICAKALILNFFALGLGMLTVLAFRYEEFKQLSQTVYPGNRWGSGGGVPMALWVSQVLPTLTYFGWHDLLNSNACEAAAVGSLLPLFLFFYSLLRFKISDPGNFTKHSLKRILANKDEIVLILFFLFFTYWQLLGFPIWLSKVSLLGHMGASRTLIVSGPILLVLVLKLISKIEFESFRIYAALGMTAITALVCGLVFEQHRNHPNYMQLYNLSGFKKIYAYFLEHDDWLALGILVILLILAFFLSSIFKYSCSIRILIFDELARPTFIAVLLLPSILIWGLFNPIYSAEKVFAISKTPAAIHARNYFAARAKSIILPGQLGPVGFLEDINVRTPTSAQESPPIEFWKKLLGSRYQDYETTLNRFAYIDVERIPEPVVIGPNYIQVPKKWFLGNTNFIVPEFRVLGASESLDSSFATHKIGCNMGDKLTQVDSLLQRRGVNGWTVDVSGWLNDSEIHNYAIRAYQAGNQNLQITYLSRQTRFDVLNAINFPSAVSGYILKLEGINPKKCINVDFYEEQVT
jgi:hypothetical protein